MSKTPKNCSNCGKCCTLEVEVYSEDEVPEEMTEWMSEWKRPILVMKRNPNSNTCIALDVKTLKCSIYIRRPTQCREFDLGGKTCLMVRESCKLKDIIQ